MDTPLCPTCNKPMEPNPARLNTDGPCKGMYGSPGDPAFVCLTEDAAHDAARAARTAESKRLLDEALTLRMARDARAIAAARIGAAEAAALAAKGK